MRLAKGDLLKKLALLGAGVGLAAGILVMTRSSHAADHLDSPTAAMNPMADIGDVYAWMNNDASKVNLVMTVSPADDGTRHFDKSVQYVWHVTSHPGATAAAAFEKPGTEVNVMCTFTSDTAIQCWVASGTTTLDYVKGDPSTSGVTSSDGKLKVFAGRRSDPFYFNLGGFHAAQAIVEGAIANNAIASFDLAGCPALTTGPGGQAPALQTALQSPPTNDPICAAGVLDCFATFNVKAIVVQVDKTLLLSGADVLLSVWGSTHSALN
jgi:hypothetical protein